MSVFFNDSGISTHLLFSSNLSVTAILSHIPLCSHVFWYLILALWPASDDMVFELL